MKAFPEARLTLKNPVGARHWSGDRLPFLTGSIYGHKNFLIYPKTSQLESSKAIFLLPLQVFQKSSQL